MLAVCGIEPFFSNASTESPPDGSSSAAISSALPDDGISLQQPSLTSAQIEVQMLLIGILNPLIRMDRGATSEAMATSSAMANQASEAVPSVSTGRRRWGWTPHFWRCFTRIMACIQPASRVGLRVYDPMGECNKEGVELVVRMSTTLESATILLTVDNCRVQASLHIMFPLCSN